MAKKGFSVGKEALFKKIMPTNQDTEDVVQESVNQEKTSESALEMTEHRDNSAVSPSVETTHSTREAVSPKTELAIESAQMENIVLNEKQAPVEQQINAEIEPKIEPKIEIQQENQESKQQQPEPAKPIIVPETADEMMQKDIVRPMIYGLPEDKQPTIQQQQFQQPMQQQQMMQAQMPMPGQEIPMYPAPGYMPPPYPMAMTEQGAYGQNVQPNAGGYPQQAYMPGYAPQYYPMATPNPYYHPNAAFATMYYATGQDGQPQQVVAPQMVVDGAKLSLYDMLEDIPPAISAPEEVVEPLAPEQEKQEEVIAPVEPEAKWKLVNIVEQLVEDKVCDLMKRDKEICMCDKCKMDVMALALNKIIPHYVAVSELSRALMELYYQENKVDIMVAIFEAIDIVKTTPRHEEG